MAKDIMTSGIEMSDVIKTTGFPVPEDMEGKTFAECVSGGGGNVTLYAWKEDFFSLRCYTYTDSPNVGDTIIYGAYGDVSSDIQIDEDGVLSVGENTIVAFLDTQRTYTRYPDGDIVLQAGEDGGIIAEPLAVTENGVYTAPSGKAYSPVTVNVPKTLYKFSYSLDAVAVDSIIFKEEPQVGVPITGYFSVRTSYDTEDCTELMSGSFTFQNLDFTPYVLSSKPSNYPYSNLYFKETI